MVVFEVGDAVDIAGMAELALSSLAFHGEGDIMVS